MNVFRQTLTAELCDAVLGLWQGETSPLSPLTSHKPNPPANIRKRLQDCAWLDAEGHLAPVLNDLLRSLSQANQATNIILGAAGQQASYSLYTAPGSAAPVGIFSEQEGQVELLMPASQEVFQNLLQAYFAASAASAAPLALDIAPPEALALAALLDLQRLAVISASTTADPALRLPERWNTATLLRVLQRDVNAEPAYWVISILLEGLLEKTIWTPDKVEAALANLGAAQIVERRNDGNYTLAGPILPIIRRLIAPERIISLALQWTGQQDDFQDISEEESLALCAQEANLLFLRLPAGNISLRTPSNDELIAAICAALFSTSTQAHGLLHSLPASSEAGVACPKCGNLAAPGKKFCKVCGTRLPEPPSVTPAEIPAPAPIHPILAAPPIMPPPPAPVLCPKCGNPIQPGKKFCSQCGNRLPESAPLDAAALMSDAAHPVSEPLHPSPVAPPEEPPAAKICPKCSSPIQPGKKFCNQCGARLPESAALIADAAPPVSEPIHPSLAAPPEEPPAPTICPKCSSPIQPGKKFCNQCGNRLPASASLDAAALAPEAASPTAQPVVCPQCGTLIQPGKKFCKNCGRKL